MLSGVQFRMVFHKGKSMCLRIEKNAVRKINGKNEQSMRTAASIQCKIENGNTAIVAIAIFRMREYDV